MTPEEQVLYEAEKAVVMATILPEWVTLPPEVPVHKLSAVQINGDWKVVSSLDPGNVYDNPVDAYDDLLKVNRDADFEFTDSLNRPEWGRTDAWGGESFFAVSNRYLVNVSRETKIMLIKTDYRNSIKYEEEYLKNPSSWVDAYHFLMHHPMNWRRRSADPESRGYSDWLTGDGLAQIWSTVSKDATTGTTYVFLEHGPSYGERVHSSHDHYLDVVGITFEDAYVKLAQKVHKFYNIDGSSKEPTPL